MNLILSYNRLDISNFIDKVAILNEYIKNYK